MSAFRVGRWKKQYGTTPPASVAGVSVPELERRSRALERENADLREQRTILKKAVTIFSYIEVFYNRVRLHGALGFYSPVNFEDNLN